MATYTILLDLLYDRRSYGEVLRIHAEIQKRCQGTDRDVSITINAIIFATYFMLVSAYNRVLPRRSITNFRNSRFFYTQNTPVHDQLAFDLYKDLNERGQTTQYPKSIALVAAMKLRRHKPEESLEILSTSYDKHIEIRYVRILTHAYLYQFDEVFQLLEMTIESPYTEYVSRVPKQLVI